jgi:hypothetical protein
MSGSSPITYFSVTTNAAAEMPLLSIIGPGGTNCEVAMYYGACSGGNLISGSSMCFYDAEGLWAPAENYTLLPNTTYNLRIKTVGSGNIAITAQSYTPPNDDCVGAMQVGPTPIHDNNACAHPGPGVIPSQICAFTLENTVFYNYMIAATGSSTITLSNIACDNGDVNNSNGFQLGFFTGNCGLMVPVSCVSNSGTIVTATTTVLPAGTIVYAVIDGVAGANCQYDVSATNSTELAAYIKYFSAWKGNRGNIIKWVSMQEFNNDRFEIERSTNGKDFSTIATIAGQIESHAEKKYQYEDNNAPQKSFYRLKQVNLDGRVKYGRVVAVTRTDMPFMNLNFDNPVTANLVMNIETNTPGKVNFRLISMDGRVLMNETKYCTKGENHFYKDFSTLAPGKYIIEATGEKLKASKVFLKTNGTSSFK